MGSNEEEEVTSIQGAGSDWEEEVPNPLGAVFGKDEVAMEVGVYVPLVAAKKKFCQ